MQPALVTSPAIAVTGLSKAYGGQQALTDMTMLVAPGSVHAVVGENGAGKSTLMKLLAGAITPDSGEIRIGGHLVELTSPAVARSLGVGIVYQELSVLPERSILANIFLVGQPLRHGLVDRKRMSALATPVLERIGLRVDPAAPVSSLGVGDRQLVEITRVLIERPRVLIMDEPNSALNERETRRLFELLRELSADGITIVYVSHRLEEVFEIADRITVVRNGALVWTRDRSTLSISTVVEAMVGARQDELFPARERAAIVAQTATIESCLSVEGMTVGNEIVDVSFRAAPGEIVGLAGLEGSGSATLLGALFGTRRPSAGYVRYPDGSGVPPSPTYAARHRVSLVPADRQSQGLMLDQSVAWNMSQITVGALKRQQWLRRSVVREAAQRQVRRLRIKTGSVNVAAGELSGGNQQKVVIGKWLEIQPRIFLLDDPTRGVDVGAKREIYRLIRTLADEGGIVIFRSTELPELVGLADRILVLYRGRLTAELKGGSVDDAGLLHVINTGSLRPR